jgi:hypothetical protein
MVVGGRRPRRAGAAPSNSGLGMGLRSDSGLLPGRRSTRHDSNSPPRMVKGSREVNGVLKTRLASLIPLDAGSGNLRLPRARLMRLPRGGRPLAYPPARRPAVENRTDRRVRQPAAHSPQPSAIDTKEGAEARRHGGDRALRASEGSVLARHGGAQGPAPSATVALAGAAEQTGG